MDEAGNAPHRIWDADTYARAFDFVPRYGEDVVTLLAPQPGEHILNLGCGTGRLTASIRDAGAAVVGLDADQAMIASARASLPDIEFIVGDGQSFQLLHAVDAVFSNAALHWMKIGRAHV